MKKACYRFLLISLPVCAAWLLSCKKNITPAPIVSSTPLQALINSDTSLSVFYALVKKSNDSIFYAGVDSSLFLMPTNTAFAAGGITPSATSTAVADSILRFYYIPGPVQLIAGSYNPYVNKLGITLYGYGALDSSGSYFNGTAAAAQKLAGSNATVLKLNQLLQPSFISIGQLIDADTSLSLFAAAVKRIGFNLIPANGWNTILAPVDTAFAAAGYTDMASISNANTDTLHRMLQFHLLNGEYLTANLGALSSIAASSADTVRIFNNSGVLNLSGSDSSQHATIVVPNRVAAGNVILHTISRVLHP